MNGSSIGRTPALSLRAPISNEEERAQFQGRLAFTSLALFLLAGSFWLVTMLSIVLVAPAEAHLMWTMPASRVEVGTTLLCLVGWLLTRGGPRSSRMLDVIDAASGFGVCLGWALMTAFQPA